MCTCIHCAFIPGSEEKRPAEGAHSAPNPFPGVGQSQHPLTEKPRMFPRSGWEASGGGALRPQGQGSPRVSRAPGPRRPTPYDGGWLRLS